MASWDNLRLSMYMHFHVHMSVVLCVHCMCSNLLSLYGNIAIAISVINISCSGRKLFDQK